MTELGALLLLTAGVGFVLLALYREAAEREAQPARSDGLPTPKTPDPGMRGPW